MFSEPIVIAQSVSQSVSLSMSTYQILRVHIRLELLVAVNNAERQTVVPAPRACTPIYMVPCLDTYRKVKAFSLAGRPSSSMSPVAVYGKCAGRNDGDLTVSGFCICGANSYGACKRTCRKILSRAHDILSRSHEMYLVRTR